MPECRPFDAVTPPSIWNSPGDSDCGCICGHDYAAVLGGVVAAVDEFCHEHGQELAIVTDEVEEPVIPRFAWSPATCPYNSFAIQLEK